MTERSEDVSIIEERSVEPFKSHTQNVYQLLVFPKLERIISCSADCSIRMFKMNSLDYIGIINKHRSFVYDMIKWDDQIFLSCGCDNKIYSWRILRSKPFYEADKEFLFFQNRVCQMMKIDNDRFLVATKQPELSIVSYSKQVRLKTLQQQDVNSIYSKLVRSKNFPSSFYMNISKPDTFGPTDRSVKLIDFEENKVVKFINTVRNFDVRSMTSYLNKQDEEIVIVGFDDSRLGFLNFGRKDEVSKDVGPIRKVSIPKDQLDSGSASPYILSLLVFQDYLFVGRARGSIFLYRLQHNSNGEEKCGLTKMITWITEIRNLHQSWVWDMKIIKVDREEGIMRCVSCCDSRTIKIWRAQGLVIRGEEDSMTKKDLKERVEFLYEDVFLMKMISENFVVRFVVGDVKFKIFKSFIMM